MWMPPSSYNFPDFRPYSLWTPVSCLQQNLCLRIRFAESPPQSPTTSIVVVVAQRRRRHRRTTASWQASDSFPELTTVPASSYSSALQQQQLLLIASDVRCILVVRKTSNFVDRRSLPPQLGTSMMATDSQPLLSISHPHTEANSVHAR